MDYLHIADFTAGGPYHVAVFDASRLRPSKLHGQDFYEIMYVHQGEARHDLAGHSEPLRTGELVLIRPQDVHSVRGVPGEPALITNVAFSKGDWTGFCAFVGIDPDRPWPAAGDGPPSCILAAQELAVGAQVFEQIMRDYLAGPTPLQLCSFWSRLLLAARGNAPVVLDECPNAPGWLKQACLQVCLPENLVGGVGRLAQIAGVSGAHLSRTMRQTMGRTPTEFVNEERLRRAAALLISTSADIAGIAFDCGFENLSYFYRRFRSRFGQTPRAYRLHNSRSIVP